MDVQLHRRMVLAGLGYVGLAGCATTPVLPTTSTRPVFQRRAFAPLLTDPGRLSRITVCTRPFRAQGPRIEVETVADKRVVHNYGHGGSGWSPDSRIAAEASVSADFAARWEAMARRSWVDHHAFVGLDGDPVRFIDQYNLSAKRGGNGAVGPAPTPGRIGFVRYGDRLADLVPHSRELAMGEHPFPVASARVVPQMTFNVAEYARQLTEAFLMEGGRIVPRVFNHPSELASLAEPVVVNCTGYGARALFGDESVVPVRGQIAWLTPQPELTYALNFRAISMVPRHDGIVIQANGASQMVGYGVEDETPDRAESEQALAALATLYASA